MLKFSPWILLFLAANLLYGQPDINLEKVQGDGLTNYYIKSITQDKDGFLWFGTEEGLFRYDGYNYMSIKSLPDDIRIPNNRNIEFLYPEDETSLWVGSRGGLSCVNTHTLTRTCFPAPGKFTVYSLVPLNDSVFLVGTSHGIHYFFKRSHTWRQVNEIGDLFIRNISWDGKKRLYITTHSGLYSYDTAARILRHYDLPNYLDKKWVQQIAHRSLLDKNGILWLTTWNAGILTFDTRTEKFLDPKITHRDTGIVSYVNSYDILDNQDGNLWIANGENGISLFNLSKNTFSRQFLHWDDDKNIPAKVFSLFIDKTGICWVGTEDGVYKSDPHTRILKNIYFRSDNGTIPGISAMSPLSLFIDKDGLYWVGTYRGIFTFDPGTGIMTDHNRETGLTSSTMVANIFPDDAGNIWLTAASKMVRVTPERKDGRLILHARAFGTPGIESIIMKAYVDSKKRVWLGTRRNGIYQFETGTGQFLPFPCRDKAIYSCNEIRTFLEMEDGSLLAGGEYTGLLRIWPSNGAFEKIKPFNDAAGETPLSIYSIRTDRDGQICIGTEGSGLWITDKPFQKPRQYTMEDGLPSMNIIEVLPGYNDHLWLVTDGGLVDFRSKTKRLTIFSKNAGIRNLYSLQAMLTTPDGDLCISDMGCLHLLDQGQLIRNRVGPRVIITGLRIFDRSFPLTAGKTIELKHDQNYFSFDYTALNYTQTGLNNYSYMLEGLDKQWNDAGTRRYVSYSNLDEGVYTFRVKASNNEGIWSTQPASLQLIIHPPFWHKWWFYGLILVSLVLLAYGIHRLRENQRKSKEELRYKIARDLHDDIGSTLSGIHIFSKLALQKVHSDQQASGDLLRKINERSEKTMEALSDIVWSINTRKDDMNNVLSKMLEYLGEVAEPSGIRYEFSVEPSIYHLHADMEIRKEAYLIFKEAVNNAVKYAGCSLIRVLLEKKRGSIILEIQDNGKGFDPDEVPPGNGIHNMRERAWKIDGETHIQSRPGDGTTIRLTFPITRIR